LNKAHAVSCLVRGLAPWAGIKNEGFTRIRRKKRMHEQLLLLGVRCEGLDRRTPKFSCSSIGFIRLMQANPSFLMPTEAPEHSSADGSLIQGV
jgi:hypothetical protein